MKTDPELQHDVAAELRWDPSVHASRIGVGASGGLVTLSGIVSSYAQVWCAKAAALRVSGVKGVVTQLHVELPARQRRTDHDIADAAHHALAWNALVPAETVKILVEDGRVTLHGIVEWEYQSRAAETQLRNLVGIRDLVNLIEIKPNVDPRDVTPQIKAALRRRGRRYAGDISVRVNGGTVTLSGQLDSCGERHAVRLAAWRAPGIRSVVDQTTITA